LALVAKLLESADYTVLHMASRTPSSTFATKSVPLFLAKGNEDPSTLEALYVDEVDEEIVLCASLSCVVLNYATSAANNEGLAARL